MAWAEAAQYVGGWDACAICGRTVHGIIISRAIASPNQALTANPPTYDQVPDSSQLVNPVRQLCYNGIYLRVAHV